MKLNPNKLSATVSALVALHNLGEEGKTLRENAKEHREVVSTSFMDLFHAKGATPKAIDTECERIYLATVKACDAYGTDGEPLFTQAEMWSSWSQYKSDVKKALRLTVDEPAERAKLTNMTALKAFINGNATGPAAVLKRMKAQITALRDSTKGAEGKVRREAGLARLEEIYLAAEAEADAYLAKHGYTSPNEDADEDAPIIEAADDAAAEKAA